MVTLIMMKFGKCAKCGHAMIWPYDDALVFHAPEGLQVGRNEIEKLFLAP